MSDIKKIKVGTGLYWVEVPEAQVYILCGCPADSVKHLMKKGLIAQKEENGVTFESGPNVILLSDILIQNGAFSNMAEFPVLQMFYRQGMILPEHPNNTGVKPMIVGSDDQVSAQLQYIYRGNYGLISKEELMEGGLSAEAADVQMKIKMKFAFGKIKPFNELLDCTVVSGNPVEIRDGVNIKRLSINVFEISYKDSSVTVDLNLAPQEEYELPYPLGFHKIKREYFSIVHTGEGDGWDINRPCMASILIFQGKVYLIDAGPNIMHSLKSLGISINEIEGLFNTHCHDDHFAGLMTLMRSDHKIKYFATQHVRASVTKKLCALTSMQEEHFGNYFEIHDLWIDAWNEIDALEVKPVISPHPVETTIFYFRVLGNKGYTEYGHLADIGSTDVLKKMIDPENGITQQYYDSVWREYLTKVDIKKLDIGGGMIHGDAVDFAEDKSGKIFLAHSSLELSNEQKMIGSGAPFGMSDTLISAHQEFIRRYAFSLLSAYFPSIPKTKLTTLLNNPMVTFNPESIIMKSGEVIDNIYLILTGNLEIIKEGGTISTILSSGSIAGEYGGLTQTPLTETYRTMNFVNALKISSSLYSEFVMINEVFERIVVRIEMQDFLQHIWLFNEALSYSVLSDIIANIKSMDLQAGMRMIKGSKQGVYIIKEGECQLTMNNEEIETLREGEFFGESSVLFDTPDLYQVIATKDAEIYFIESDAVEGIPIVHWKMFEIYRKRLMKILTPSREVASAFRWRDEYSVNIQDIDTDHKMMFDAADSLSHAIELKEDTLALKDILEFLINYTNDHFKREERLMERYGYPELELHARNHSMLSEEVQKFKARSDANEISIDAAFLKFLQDWILDHILTEDRKIGAYLNKLNIY